MCNCKTPCAVCTCKKAKEIFFNDPNKDNYYTTPQEEAELEDEQWWSEDEHQEQDEWERDND